MATYIDNNKPFYIEGTITPANRSAIVRLKQDEKSTGYMQVTPESEPGVIANSLIQTPYAGTEYIDEAPLKGNAEPTFMLENQINALVTEKARIFSLVNMDKATKAAKISEIDDQIRGLKLKINYRSGSAGFDNVVKYANIPGPTPNIVSGATNAATGAVTGTLDAATGAVTGLANGFSSLFAPNPPNPPRPTEAELTNALAIMNRNSTRGGTRRRRKHHKNKTNHRVKRRTTNKMFKMFGFGGRRRTKNTK